MTAMLFVIAAGAGAGLRHVVNRTGHGWLGTLAVNVVGSFLLGWVVAAEPAASTVTVIGTGLLGSFTTFSMFALEVAEAGLVQRVAIVTGSVALGVGAAALGFAIA